MKYLVSYVFCDLYPGIIDHTHVHHKFSFAFIFDAVFLPACLNKAIQITSVSSISATVLQYWSSLQPGSLHFYSDVFG